MAMQGKYFRKGVKMVRRTYTPEQIINKLREVEVLISQGATAAEDRGEASYQDRTSHHPRLHEYRSRFSIH